jgi:hypothetical protein
VIDLLVRVDVHELGDFMGRITFEHNAICFLHGFSDIRFLLFFNSKIGERTKTVTDPLNKKTAKKKWVSKKKVKRKNNNRFRTL